VVMAFFLFGSHFQCCGTCLYLAFCYNLSDLGSYPCLCSSCHIKLEVLGLLSYSIAKLELGKSAFSGRSSLLNIASIISMHKVLIVNLSFWHRKWSLSAWEPQCPQWRFWFLTPDDLIWTQLSASLLAKAVYNYESLSLLAFRL